MKYKCVFKFCYSDMESRSRIMMGNTEIDLDDATTLLNAKDNKIEELKQALSITNLELSRAIDEVNNSLDYNSSSSDLDDPDYWDKETCHNNSLLLRE